MQPRPPRQNTEAELAALATTCDRLSGFNPDIGVEWVDGFLTALAASPRLPEPGAWLPALCGDAFERAFADPEDHATALRSLQTRLKVLCDQLDPAALLDAEDTLRLEPLMGEVTDDDRQKLVTQAVLTAEEAALMQTGSVWAEGFLEGVQAFSALWAVPVAEYAEALFKQAFDQIGGLLFAPGSDAWKAHLAEYYPKDEPTRDELLAEAILSVQDLRLLWVDFAPKTETRHVQATPGRNDACPCGSGKKFKKCHGSAVA